MAELRREQWLCEPLPADVRAALARLERAPDVRHVAVMPDVHLARDVCIGTVVGTGATIYPQAVGGDIGCGMTTVRLSAAPPSLDERAATDLLLALRADVPVLRHPAPQPLPATLDDLSPEVARSRLLRDLSVQHGTVGRGNHFVELQRDDDGALWLLVHSGSRALGPAVRARWTAGRRGLVGLPVAGDGAGYLADHDVAVAFARDNRRACLDGAVRAVQRVLGEHVAPDAATLVDVVHNFVRRERHDGRELWVHRKGASSARAGEPGVIPGSMGTGTVHVSGRGAPAALASSSHGAGRAMARGVAMRRVTRRQLVRELDGVHFDPRLADRLRDEAPTAYKDLDRVLRAQRDLVRVVRRLRPVLVHKGG